MSDIFEGESSGDYRVTISGPIEAGEWTWTGYADNSADALAIAEGSRLALFAWDGEKFALKGNGNGIKSAQ